MGRFLYFNNLGAPPSKENVEVTFGAGPLSRDALRSNFGFVLYDQEPFRNQFGTATDPYGDEDSQMKGGGAISSAESKEESWLDANGVPVLINRYNGTLIRGE